MVEDQPDRSNPVRSRIVAELERALIDRALGVDASANARIKKISDIFQEPISGWEGVFDPAPAGSFTAVDMRHTTLHRGDHAHPVPEAIAKRIEGLAGMDPQPSQTEGNPFVLVRRDQLFELLKTRFIYMGYQVQADSLAKAQLERLVVAYPREE